MLSLPATLSHGKHTSRSSARSLNTMAVNEGAADWHLEARRLASFSKWPSTSSISPSRLAKAGFYSTGQGDEVRCFCCGTLIMSWSNDANPMEEHRKHSPACPFLVNPQEAGNIPLVDGYRPVVQCTQEAVQSDYGLTTSDGAEVFDNASNLLESHTSVPHVGRGYNQQRDNMPICSSLAYLQQTTQHVTIFEGLNMNVESNRLRSFERWPRHSIIPEDLAAAGFYYTGKDDECQCFSCKGRVLLWDEGDIPLEEHRKHFPECPFLRNPEASGNVPIQRVQTPFNMFNGQQSSSDQESVTDSEALTAHSVNSSLTASDSVEVAPPNLYTHHSLQNGHRPVESHRVSTMDSPITSQSAFHTNSASIYNREFLRFEENRLKTYNDFPKKNTMNVAKMAAVGLYFVGPGDKVKCAFCNGAMVNWDTEDDPANEHFKYFGDRCPLARGDATDNVPLKGSEVKRRSTFELLNIVTEKPKSHRMASETSRIASFKNWPLHDIQDPADLAKAGFYFTGNEDQVACFFCGLVLKNWDPSDDPWEQHARWADNCGFLRQAKGENYMYEVKRSHALVHNNQTKTERTTCETNEARKVDRRQINAAMSLPTTILILNMGFSKDLVKAVLEDRFKSSGENFSSAADLAEAVMDWQESGRPINAKEAPSVKAPSTNAGQKTVRPPKKQDKNISCSEVTEQKLTVEEENRQLKDQCFCKVCKKKSAVIVFLPCGHMVTCDDCCSQVKACNVCGAVIRGTVKAYLG